AALRDLIRSDPAQALSLALSPETLAELAAAFPESAFSLESYGTWQGPIERWVADSADLKWSRTLTRMNIGAQALDLYFAGPEPAGLTSGSMLQVTGVQVGATAAVTGSSITSLDAMTSSSASPAAVTISATTTSTTP